MKSPVPRRSASGMCENQFAQYRGRRECRVRDAPAASHAKQNEHTSVVTTVTPVSPGIPRANGFNGFLRSLPGDRAFLPPSSARCAKHPRRLDTSVGVSGRYDFAVRKHAHSSRAPRASIASRSYVRDDRDTPLFRNGMPRVVCLIWVFRKAKNFRKGDWTEK
jgi:hypothetical protein